ncbi:TPA: hypothetical protein OUB44_003984 [Providencia rettgeri]|nr:hypothetical protein [Providencia rettgeri]
MDTDLLNEELNDAQKKLKEELTYRLILTELIVYLDLCNPEWEPSKFMKERLEGTIKILPETKASHDPTVRQAYEEALGIVNFAIKDRDRLTRREEKKEPQKQDE